MIPYEADWAMTFSLGLKAMTVFFGEGGRDSLYGGVGNDTTGSMEMWIQVFWSLEKRLMVALMKSISVILQVELS